MISLTNATTLHTNFSEIALLIVEYILVSPNTIEEYLKKLGFKKITLRRNRFDFKNHMINFIVKRPSFLQVGLPEQAVPTIFLGDGWVMQPVVKTDTESRRTAYINLLAGKRGQVSCDADIHLYNVGIYNGTEVLFDW